MKNTVKTIKNAVILQTKIYNKKHKSKTYNKENLVLLSTKNLSQKCFHKKLLHKFIESFQVHNIVKNKHTVFIYLSFIEFTMCFMFCI